MGSAQFAPTSDAVHRERHGRRTRADAGEGPTPVGRWPSRNARPRAYLMALRQNTR
ncbi:hypothetical protein BURMUCGD1_4131 [Burkholderia multivorans CGD1]|nr:hypothetical protein BURMUCGD1_4131 [Burkholderia multivorans CGD1]